MEKVTASARIPPIAVSSSAGAIRIGLYCPLGGDVTRPGGDVAEVGGDDAVGRELDRVHAASCSRWAGRWPSAASCSAGVGSAGRRRATASTMPAAIVAAPARNASWYPLISDDVRPWPSATRPLVWFAAMVL